MNNQVDKFNKRYGYTSKIELNTVSPESYLQDDKEYVEELKSKVRQYIEKTRNQQDLTDEEKNDFARIKEYLEQERKNMTTDDLVEQTRKELEDRLEKNFEQVDETYNAEVLDTEPEVFEPQNLEPEPALEPEKKTFFQKVKENIKNRAEHDEAFETEQRQQAIIKTRIDNFNQRIKDTVSSPESKDTLTLLKERVRILEKRAHTLEKRIANYQERKDTLAKQLLSRSARSFQTLGDWYEASGGTKKLSNRILLSVGISGIMGAFGFGTGLASVIGGVPGAYFGQGIGRGFYDKFIRKDFRIDLVKLRKEGLQNPEGISSEYEREDILRYRKRRYLDRLHNINDAVLAKHVRRSEGFKKMSGVLGGVVFGGITREAGADILKSIGVPDTNLFEHFDSLLKRETVTGITGDLEMKGPQVELEENPLEKTRPDFEEGVKETKEVIPNYEDIKIRKGEGITHAFKRQIAKSAELREYFQLSDNPTEADLIKASAKAATETGYLSDTQEVRVYLDKNAGYELSLKDGKLFAQEYEGIVEKNGTYLAEKKEFHVGGDTFEGEHIEKHREYLTEKGAFQTVYDTPETTIDFKEESIIEPIKETKIDLKEVFPESFVEEKITLEDEPLVSEKFFQKTERSLDNLPGYKNIGGSILGKSLGPKFDNLMVPEYLVTLFENTQHPEHFIRINDQLMEIMGLEINREPFKSASEMFRIKGTNKLVGWKYIYEHANIAELKKAVTEAQR